MKKLVVPPPRVALRPVEAAASIGVGVDFFEEHVAPSLRVVRVGTKRLYPVNELERWLAASAEEPLAKTVGG